MTDAELFWAIEKILVTLEGWVMRRRIEAQFARVNASFTRQLRRLA
jgi:hypothetical protein